MPIFLGVKWGSRSHPFSKYGRFIKTLWSSWASRWPFCSGNTARWQPEGRVQHTFYLGILISSKGENLESLALASLSKVLGSPWTLPALSRSFQGLFYPYKYKKWNIKRPLSSTLSLHTLGERGHNRSSHPPFHSAYGTSSKEIFQAQTQSRSILKLHLAVGSHCSHKITLIEFT